MTHFSELLAGLRESRKMTQKDLAGILYVSPGTISNYENGAHYPDIEKLMALADFFGVTTDYLLGRCSTNLSPDVWNEVIIDDITAGEIINDIRGMAHERKRALAVILSDMKLGTVVGQYGKGEML